MTAMTKMDIGLSEDAVLPLVLVTVGGANDEMEALQLHLDGVEQQTEPRFQSLIVTRPDLPRMFYNVLCARVRPLPNVHIRRLGTKDSDCCEMLHETGTFFANAKRSFEKD